MVVVIGAISCIYHRLYLFEKDACHPLVSVGLCLCYSHKRQISYSLLYDQPNIAQPIVEFSLPKNRSVVNRFLNDILNLCSVKYQRILNMSQYCLHMVTSLALCCDFVWLKRWDKKKKQNGNTHEICWVQTNSTNLCLHWHFCFCSSESTLIIIIISFWMKFYARNASSVVCQRDDLMVFDHI